MADSNITKKALAEALKNLLIDNSFDKVTVAQICEKCDMNRKSFYYHFKDKYDLVNWIFETEFITLIKIRPEDEWALFEAICSYFYENRGFYRRVLRIHGQNSFPEYLLEFLHPILYERLKYLTKQEHIHPICIDFFADGIVCTIERWLLENEKIPPKQFVNILKTLIQSSAVNISKEVDFSEK